MWTRGPAAPEVGGVTSETARRTDLDAADEAARTAILGIFMATGVGRLARRPPAAALRAA